jgi:hypothetical protein
MIFMVLQWVSWQLKYFAYQSIYPYVSLALEPKSGSKRRPSDGTS